MLIVPAIDLMGGSCVRLLRGSFDNKTTYPRDPVETARMFASDGARLIHIVDLDAARGNGNNRAVIAEICKAVNCTIEIGGGIRSEDDIEELAAIGVNRLILGTVLVREQEKVQSWAKKWGHKLIAGIDAENGMVKVAGWEAGSSWSDVDLAVYCASIGLGGIIYTNIDRDGTLGGPDLERTRKIADASLLPVIISGGIGSLQDLEASSREAEKGPGTIVGAITGKAVYEGKFTVKQAVSEFQKEGDKP